MKYYTKIAITFITFCSSLFMINIVSAEDKVAVKLGLDWSLYGSHAPFFLAKKNKIFEKYGLDVKIVEGSGSATTAQQLGQGGYEFAYMDYATLIYSVAKEVPIKAILRMQYDVNAIISHADNPINNPKELEGHKIAYSPSESTAVAIPALYAANDVNVDKLKVVHPASGAKLALFLQKQVDAIPGYYNLQVPQIEARGVKTTYFTYGDFGVGVLSNGLAVNVPFAKEHPEVVRKFSAAIQEAIAEAVDSPKEAIEDMIAINPTLARDRDLLIKEWEMSQDSLSTPNVSSDKPTGWMVDQDWEDTIEVLRTHGDLRQVPSIESLYTNEYLVKP